MNETRFFNIGSYKSDAVNADDCCIAVGKQMVFCAY